MVTRPGIFLALMFVAVTSAVAAPRGDPPATNPVIRDMTAKISAARIEAYIRKLATFETRHTLSEVDSDTHRDRPRRTISSREVS